MTVEEAAPNRTRLRNQVNHSRDPWFVFVAPTFVCTFSSLLFHNNSCQGVDPLDPLRGGEAKHGEATVR